MVYVGVNSFININLHDENYHDVITVTLINLYGVRIKDILLIEVSGDLVEDFVGTKDPNVV